MDSADTLRVTTLAERPELVARVYEIDESWPVFVPHDLVANALLGQVVETFPAYCVVATDGDRVVARGLSVPFDAESEGRDETSAQGWDRVLTWAFLDRRDKARTTAASALEIGWTGLPFDRPGEVDVPGALVPVHCDPTAGQAVYVEPNVWIRHRAEHSV
jgi:hypothetical protein